MSKKKQSWITIYTDGSCDNNRTHIGGWGAVIQLKSLVIELSGCQTKTTSNRMEMTAAMMALKAVKTPSFIEIVTDSQYLMLGAQKRGWEDRGGKVINGRLWKKLIRYMDRHEVVWTKVRGHSGVKGNERADKLAGAEFRKLTKRLMKKK